VTRHTVADALYQTAVTDLETLIVKAGKLGYRGATLHAYVAREWVDEQDVKMADALQSLLSAPLTQVLRRVLSHPEEHS
jgi:hypothetical protein